MKKGDRVNTPYGDGTVDVKENFSRVERYGVKMDDKTITGYKDNVMYFFENQLSKIENISEDNK